MLILKMVLFYFIIFHASFYCFSNHNNLAPKSKSSVVQSSLGVDFLKQNNFRAQDNRLLHKAILQNLPDIMEYSYSVNRFIGLDETVDVICENLLMPMIFNNSLDNVCAFHNSKIFYKNKKTLKSGKDDFVAVTNKHQGLLEIFSSVLKSNNEDGKNTVIINSDLHHDTGYLEKEEDFLGPGNWIHKLLEVTNINFVIQVVPGKDFYKLTRKKVITNGKKRKYNLITLSLDMLNRELKRLNGNGFKYLLNSMDLDATIGTYNAESEFHGYEMNMNEFSKDLQYLLEEFFSYEVYMQIDFFLSYVRDPSKSLEELDIYLNNIKRNIFLDIFNEEEFDNHLNDAVSILFKYSKDYYSDYLRELKDSKLTVLKHGIALSQDYCPLPYMLNSVLKIALTGICDFFDMEFSWYDFPEFRKKSIFTYDEMISAVLKTISHKEKSGSSIDDLSFFLISLFKEKKLRKELSEEDMAFIGKLYSKVEFGNYINSLPFSNSKLIDYSY